MTSNIAATLSALGFDADPQKHEQFYTERSEGAFSSGRWGAGYLTVLGTVVHAADYDSPDCPEGWDTFWGHLSRNEPDVLSIMDQFPESAESDERELDALCKRQGIRPLIVSAGAWLTRNGVFTSKAYPLHVLRAQAGIAA